MTEVASRSKVNSSAVGIGGQQERARIRDGRWGILTGKLGKMAIAIPMPRFRSPRVSSLVCCLVMNKSPLSDDTAHSTALPQASASALALARAVIEIEAQAVAALGPRLD